MTRYIHFLLCHTNGRKYGAWDSAGPRAGGRAGSERLSGSAGIGMLVHAPLFDKGQQRDCPKTAKQLSPRCRAA